QRVVGWRRSELQRASASRPSRTTSTSSAPSSRSFICGTSTRTTSDGDERQARQPELGLHRPSARRASSRGQGDEDDPARVRCTAWSCSAQSSCSTPTPLVRRHERNVMSHAISTTRLPNGNFALHLPSGELADLAYLSAASLARMGEDDFLAVLEWVTAERGRRAERVAENEQLAAERVEAQREVTEHRHALQAAWSRENRL